MFDTYITVVGTVLTRPDWKLLTKTNSVVASFRVASNSRRYDRGSEQWVDGPSLRIRVNCWRNLADGVANSIAVGDPVVVYGRIATRDWKSEEGEPRIAYEVEAITVGHDLTRGKATFEKRKHDPSSVIEDADSETRVNGEVAESISSLNAMRPGAIDSDATDRESFDDFPVGDTFPQSESPRTQTSTPCPFFATPVWSRARSRRKTRTAIPRRPPTTVRVAPAAGGGVGASPCRPKNPPDASSVPVDPWAASPRDPPGTGRGTHG